ncbi:MAG TPA: patatin-like phospholipase family protein, partial [Rhabdochlamydiaceae bacterium]|nr:patatin-like phospholipase family protein [Rhabdochlamydiaceae bacterium]
MYDQSAVQGDIPVFKANKPIKLALVLGGGGSRGVAHLGAIKELEAAGIRPDLIIGCSAGAIVGALYADNPELTGIEEMVLKMTRSDLMDAAWFSRSGVVGGAALQKFLQNQLQAKTFDQLKIPLIVIATDLHTGETVELSQNDVPKAVGASCAFPGVFPPVRLHDRYLIDGGASSPVPVEIAKKYGAEVIIAIDVSEKLPSSKPAHLFGIAKRGVEIMYLNFVEKSLAHADISIRMEFQDVGIFCDGRNRFIYEHGRQKVISMLPEIREKIKP